MNAKLNEGDVKRVEMLHAKCAEMKKELAKRVVGQDEMVDQVLTAVFARGHALLTGVPGLAKTLLVRTLAEVMDLGFKRVQFTPDLMPADVTGTEVLDEDRTTGKHVFRFVKGPVFTNLLLADEINRTPPKTQAALLEAMQEHSVTVSTASPLAARHISWPSRSSCSLRRIRLNRRVRIRFPRRSLTVSSSTSR